MRSGFGFFERMSPFRPIRDINADLFGEEKTIQSRRPDELISDLITIMSVDVVRSMPEPKQNVPPLSGMMKALGGWSLRLIQPAANEKFAYREPSSELQLEAWVTHLSYVAGFMMEKYPNMTPEVARNYAAAFFGNALPQPIRRQMGVDRSNVDSRLFAFLETDATGWLRDFNPTGSAQDVVMNVPTLKMVERLAEESRRFGSFAKELTELKNLNYNELEAIWKNSEHPLYTALLYVVAATHFSYLVTKVLQAKVKGNNDKLIAKHGVMPWNDFMKLEWSMHFKDVAQFQGAMEYLDRQRARK